MADVRIPTPNPHLTRFAKAAPCATVDVLRAGRDRKLDVKALATGFRSLRPAGRMGVTLPVIEPRVMTSEDAGVHSPRGGALHFGLKGPLRRFGREPKDQGRAAGPKPAMLAKAGKA